MPHGFPMKEQIPAIQSEALAQVAAANDERSLEEVRVGVLGKKGTLTLAAAGHNRIPVVREVLSDLDTPLSVYLKLADGPHTYLFESVEGGAVRGRYSIIGLNPDLIWKVENGKAQINRKASLDPDGFFEDTGLHPLQSLRLRDRAGRDARGTSRASLEGRCARRSSR